MRTGSDDSGNRILRHFVGILSNRRSDRQLIPGIVIRQRDSGSVHCKNAAIISCSDSVVNAASAVMSISNQLGPD
jgi:hypothetical protein